MKLLHPKWWNSVEASWLSYGPVATVGPPRRFALQQICLDRGLQTSSLRGPQSQGTPSKGSGCQPFLAIVRPLQLLHSHSGMSKKATPVIVTLATAEISLKPGFSLLQFYTYFSLNGFNDFWKNWWFSPDTTLLRQWEPLNKYESLKI